MFGASALCSVVASPSSTLGKDPRKKKYCNNKNNNHSNNSNNKNQNNNNHHNNHHNSNNNNSSNNNNKNKRTSNEDETGSPKARYTKPPSRLNPQACPTIFESNLYPKPRKSTIGL